MSRALPPIDIDRLTYLLIDKPKPPNCMRCVVQGPALLVFCCGNADGDSFLGQKWTHTGQVITLPLVTNTYTSSSLVCGVCLYVCMYVCMCEGPC